MSSDYPTDEELCEQVVNQAIGWAQSMRSHNLSLELHMRAALEVAAQDLLNHRS